MAQRKKLCRKHSFYYRGVECPFCLRERVGKFMPKTEIKDEREANNQHDWVFYILNILITSSLTLLINYLNSKFEIIKMQNEPSIDRLKTIAIEGIKTEKKIYSLSSSTCPP
jgi:hypothetical protein